MSLFGLFPKKENSYETLNQVLTSHENEAKQNLHDKHPHVKPLLEKHSVDLAKIRHHGAKVATTATILGALLAFPHLIHAPTQHPTNPNQGTFQTKVLSDSNTKPINNVSPSSNTHNQAPNQVASTADTTIQNSLTPPAKHNDNDEDDSNEHGHQGHQRGRSELAPPKEHGLHDLGYHEGEERNPDKVSAPGPHPEETTEHGKAES